MEEDTVVDPTKSPENGPIRYVMKNGDQVLHTKDGAHFVRPDGGVVLWTADDKIIATFPKVLRLEIRSLAEVVGHEISEVNGRTKHVFLFRGNGILGCSFARGDPFVEVNCLSLFFEYDEVSHVMTATHARGVKPFSVSSVKNIPDAADLFSHDIQTAVGMTTHFLRYHKGIDYQYAYNERGDVIENAGQMMRVPEDRDGNSLV